MTDSRVYRLARIMVDYSAAVRPGDKVAIEMNTTAEPLARALYELTLERGGFPHVLMSFPEQDELFYRHARDAQLDLTPTFQKLVVDTFDVYFRARADTNTRAQSSADPAKQTRFQKAFAPIRNMMMKRGGEKVLRWVLTQYPTPAYAMEAEMGTEEYAAFVFASCHADENTPDPVAYWEGVEHEQQRFIDRVEGHDMVEVHGPNANLRLSIKGRKFRNASGQHNLPDGEIYTGPVEDSANGWVRYTYPAVTQGRVVSGIELSFENGKVVQASAEKNEEFLLRMIDTDPGARYIGEFAIGNNFEVNRFTRNILFDEKIGGTFHMALGAGYPETGSRNTSAIHWDMICDLRTDSEIRVDDEVVYKNGKFIY